MIPAGFIELHGKGEKGEPILVRIDSIGSIREEAFTTPEARHFKCSVVHLRSMDSQGFYAVRETMAEIIALMNGAA